MLPPVGAQCCTAQVPVGVLGDIDLPTVLQQFGGGPVVVLSLGRTGQHPAESSDLLDSPRSACWPAEMLALDTPCADCGK